MSEYLYGLLGFVSIFLYDLNNLEHNNDRLESLYAVGAGLLGLSLGTKALSGAAADNGMPTAVRIIMGVLALGFFALLVHSSLIAGGRTSWKFGAQKSSDRWWEKKLVSTGVYALCRHPSVWWMIFLCLCLVPSVGLELFTALAYSGLSVLLALYEDKRVFPKLMAGYDSYKKTTPFLFPRRENVRRCFEKSGKGAK